MTCSRLLRFERGIVGGEFRWGVNCAELHFLGTSCGDAFPREGVPHLASLSTQTNAGLRCIFTQTSSAVLHETVFACSTQPRTLCVGTCSCT